MTKEELIEVYQRRLDRAEAKVCQTEKQYKIAKNAHIISKLLLPVGVLVLGGALVTDFSTTVKSIMAMIGIGTSAGSFATFKWFYSQEKLKTLRDKLASAKSEVREINDNLEDLRSLS